MRARDVVELLVLAALWGGTALATGLVGPRAMTVPRVPGGGAQPR